MNDKQGSKCIGCRLARKEIEALRSKLEKAKEVIEATVNLIDDYGYALGNGTEEALLALKRYRGETK